MVRQSPDSLALLLCGLSASGACSDLRLSGVTPMVRMVSAGAKATLAAGIQLCALNAQTRSTWQLHLQRFRQLSYLVFCQLLMSSKNCELRLD